jgi:16S rRNA (cytidine1402-2'-O)-methyltransferase
MTDELSKDTALEDDDAPVLKQPDLSARLMLGITRQIEKLANAPLEPGLYLVSTPIGNLADISIRALFVLAAADMAFCEDTRHSRKLFSAYGLRKKLGAYHDYSGEKDRDRIIEALTAGKSVALISDAGTPLIADPGYKLVRDAIQKGIAVFAIPGPSAVMAALVPSGLATDQFFFGGFLPPKDAARLAALESLKAVPGALILYETAARIEGTLEALKNLFPDRTVIIARELTKLHEEFLRGTAESLLETVRERALQGELVLMIGAGSAPPPSEEDIRQALAHALASARLKEAVEEVSKGLGVGRKIVYNLALKMRDETS